jgi:hypothetical protein
MAPKGALARLESALAEFKREQAQGTGGPGGKAPKSQGNWACAFCAAGGNNFAHRSNCYKCFRDRRTGVLVTPAPQRSLQLQLPAGGKARARSQGASVGAPATPKVPEAQSPVAPVGEDPQSDDPVALELATARSLHEWAKKLQPGSRERELPGALERLNKAEAADKARKPPGERLQSALSRVDHRRRLAEAAEKAHELLAAQAATAKGEAEQAQAALREARQELEVAQAVHSAWGSPRGTQSGTTYSGGSMGAVNMTEQERCLLQNVTAQLSSGVCPEAADILLRLLNATPTAGAAASSGGPPKGEAGGGGPGQPQEQAADAKLSPKEKEKAKRGREFARSRSRGADPAGDDRMGTPAPKVEGPAAP